MQQPSPRPACCKVPAILLSVRYDLQPQHSLEMLVLAHDGCIICQSNSCYGLVKIAHRPSSGSKQGRDGSKDLIGVFIQIEHKKLIKQEKSESHMYASC